MGNACTVNFNDGTQMSLDLKMSNLGNALSEVATKLDMYESEAFFYSDLASVVDNVNIAGNFGLIRHGEKVGMLLEDLRKFDGSFGRDLNKDISMLVNVVTAVTKMHQKFSFSSADRVTPSMRKLRTVNQITYYQELVANRFEKFMSKSKIF